MPCNALYWLARPDLALSYHDRHGCGLGKLRGAPWRHAGVCPTSRLDREPDQGWQPHARRPAPQSAGDERPNRPLHGDRRQGHDAAPEARVGRDLDHRDVRQALKARTGAATWLARLPRLTSEPVTFPARITS